MLYFSKSTNSFYDSEINGKNIPEDAREITPETHQAVLAAHYGGRAIAADEQGHPITVPRVVSPEQIAAALKASAQAALKDSDSIVLRCYEEAKPVPAEWVAYRRELREAIAGARGEMPAMPVTA